MFFSSVVYRKNIANLIGGHICELGRKEIEFSKKIVKNDYSFSPVSYSLLLINYISSQISLFKKGV